MSAKSSRILLRCIAVAALLAAAGPPVRAGTWSGSFDPIGFSGTDLINIGGSNCLPGASDLTNPVNFFYVNGFSFGANNCTAALLNATVNLTDLPASDTAQLTFSSSAANAGIWGADIGPDGTLLGVDSFPIGPATTSNPHFPGSWFIQLNANDGQFPPETEQGGDGPTSNTVTLFNVNCPNGNCGTSDPYTFKSVPEPGSLGLLLGALGAGWLGRRRKAAA